MAKAPKINIRGIAKYPHLNVADTKFVDAGEYKTGVMVGREQAKPIMEQLSKLYKEHTGKALDPEDTNLWKYDKNDLGEEDQNTIVFAVKAKNVLRRDGELWDRKPLQYDSKKNRIEVQIGGGSEIVVAAEVYAWVAGAKKGLTLQPAAVQVINHVSPSEGGSDFAEEDGFVGEPMKAAAPVKAPSSVEGDDPFDF